MSKTELPGRIAAFVKSQPTVAGDRLVTSTRTPEVPYCGFWQRAIAGMLLSGHVAPKADGEPNRTDSNRLCKEANFNQRLFERFSGFLIHGNIVKPTPQRTYESGKRAAAFWDRDVKGLCAASREAFLSFIQRFTGYQIWRPTSAHSSQLDAFAGTFAQAFEGLAIQEAKLAEVLVAFSRLPGRDLWQLATRVSPQIREGECNWEFWFDKTGQEAFISSLYRCDWAYGERHQDQTMIYVSDAGRIMLGLQEPPGAQPGATEFRVLPNLCVFAGADLPAKKLVPLFRYCKVVRIDRVLEFQIDKRRLSEASATDDAAKQLRSVFAEQGALPATVGSSLTSTTATGTLGIRGCSAIVKPETQELLAMIRSHSRLKGYLEAGAPPGYLLIKSASNPANFVQRCRNLGLTVKIL